MKGFKGLGIVQRLFRSLIWAFLGILPAFTGLAAFAAEPESCESRLISPFAQVVERAVEQQILSLEEVQALAASPTYVNPLRTRTPNSKIAAFIEYFRIFGEHHLSAPAWAEICDDLNRLVAKRLAGQSRVERARGETSSVIAMKRIQSLSASLHNVWRWRRLADGRNLIFFVNPERKLEVRDVLNGEPLWTGPDASAPGAVGDIGETERGFAEVRFTSLSSPIESVRLPSLKEIPVKAQPIEGAIPRRYYSSGHGADILIYENGMIFAVADHTALYLHDRDLKFSDKVIPSQRGSSILLMQKVRRATVENSFAQFIDGGWKLINSSPVVARKTTNLEIHGLQLRDTRLVVTAYSRRNGAGVVEFTRGFRDVPGAPVRIQAKRQIIIDAQALELSSGRVYLFVASTDGSASAIEVFEPSRHSRALMTREFTGKDHFQFFERDGRLMLGLFGADSFEILAPLEGNVPLYEQKISPISAGMRVLLGAGDDVYLAIEQDGLKVYELFGRGPK